MCFVLAEAQKLPRSRVEYTQVHGAMQICAGIPQEAVLLRSALPAPQADQPSAQQVLSGDDFRESSHGELL